MPREIILMSAMLILAAGASYAQQSQPYGGMQARPLKALSSEELADLKAGRGMGLALAGELNGYPGPKHVLELAKDATAENLPERLCRLEAIAGRKRHPPLGDLL